MSEFRNYVRNLTDAQVLGVIEKESESTDPSREQDLQDAKDEAAERGIA